jgi:LmbE family N-acetylglucosaminyl deacetylase
MTKSILIIAPHPDDETLGCGGTLLRHVAEGDKVYWLIGTTIKEENGFSSDRVNSRQSEIKKVCEMYEFAGYKQLDFNTTELDQIPKNIIVNEISEYVNEVKPHTMYLPYRNDVHSDHAQIFDASVACTKSFRYPFVKKVCVYETLSETEFGLRTDDHGFKPNMWVDISKYLDRKIEIMKVFESELGEHPFPRSIESIMALAMLRGSTSGCKSSEAFIILREII